MRLVQRYWLATGTGPEQSISYDEWLTRTAAAGVRPSTMRWWKGADAYRIEYVLPKG